MYNKLIVKMANGEVNEFNGYFNADTGEDYLLIFGIQSREIMKWARTQIQRRNEVNYIEFEDEGNSVVANRKFHFITNVTNDSILIK